MAGATAIKIDLSPLKIEAKAEDKSVQGAIRAGVPEVKKHDSLAVAYGFAAISIRSKKRGARPMLSGGRSIALPVYLLLRNLAYLTQWAR